MSRHNSSSNNDYPSISEIQVFNTLCFECLKSFDAGGSESKECGQKCGVRFCDLDCYRQFLLKHAREHVVVCSVVKKARPLLNDVARNIANSNNSNNSKNGGKPTRDQLSQLQLERQNLNAPLMLDEKTTPPLSEVHKLLLQLTLLELHQYFDDPMAPAIALFSCARSLQSVSLPEHALVFARFALPRIQRVFGVNDERTSYMHARLASILVDLCRYDEALEQYERQLAIAQSISPDSITCSIAMHNIGGVLKSLGRHDEAIEQLEKCAQINRREHGHVSIEYAKTLTNLANAIECSLRSEDALQCYEMSYDIFRLALGANHKHCAALLLNIAVAHRARRQLDQSRTTLEQAMRVYETVCGAEYIEIADCLILLGHIEHEQGHWEEAMKVYDRARSMFRTNYGPVHRSIAAILISISAVLRSQGRFDEALIRLRESLAMSIRLCGSESHERVAFTLIIIGDTFRQQGDVVSAIEHYQRAKSIFDKIYAKHESHPSRVETDRKLEATNQDKLRRDAKALEESLLIEQ